VGVNRRGEALRILLAEDDPQNRAMIRVVLEDAGYHVDVVENGVEVVEAVSVGEYDVVLMDVSMPVMDGLEATRRIRAFSGSLGSIPIVALTAYAMAGDRERYLGLGVTDYLSKPMHIADLIDVVERQRTNLAA
jgi:two-component system sensor histidine kinase/response regulator